MIIKVCDKATRDGSGAVKYSNGHDMAGLVRYLMGPGKANEHTDPHVIASSSTLSVEYQGLSMDEWQDGAARELGRVLEGAWRQKAAGWERASKGNDRGHVFHAAISIGEAEGELSDEVWGKIAADYVREMGFTPASGKAGCEWAAFRHGKSAAGNDHIHVAVCLVREDGTWASDHRSKINSVKLARKFERNFGLARLLDDENQRGVQAPTRAEFEIAKRRGQGEPERVRLARIVRAAAAEAHDEPSFVAAVLRRGARIRPSWEKGGRDAVRGYAVALRPDGEMTEPRWFGGGGLDRACTLPKLRDRWGVTGDQVEAAVPMWRGQQHPERGKPVASRPAQWWELAAADIAAANKALAAVSVEDTAAWRAAAAEAAGVFAEWSLRVEGVKPGPLSAASDALTRSAQPPRDAAAGTPKPRFGGQQLQLAVRGGSSNSVQGWQAILRQLDRTTSAIRAAHIARGEAVAAQRIANAAEAGLTQVRDELNRGTQVTQPGVTSAEQSAARTAARVNTRGSTVDRDNDLGR